MSESRQQLSNAQLQPLYQAIKKRDARALMLAANDLSEPAVSIARINSIKDNLERYKLELEESKDWPEYEDKKSDILTLEKKIEESRKAISIEENKLANLVSDQASEETIELSNEDIIWFRNQASMFFEFSNEFRTVEMELREKIRSDSPDTIVDGEFKRGAVTVLEQTDEEKKDAQTASNLLAFSEGVRQVFSQVNSNLIESDSSANITPSADAGAVLTEEVLTASGISYIHVENRQASDEERKFSLDLANTYYKVNPLTNNDPNSANLVEVNNLLDSLKGCFNPDDNKFKKIDSIQKDLNDATKPAVTRVATALHTLQQNSDLKKSGNKAVDLYHKVCLMLENWRNSLLSVSLFSKSTQSEPGASVTQKAESVSSTTKETDPLLPRGDNVGVITNKENTDPAKEVVKESTSYDKYKAYKNAEAALNQANENLTKPRL